VRTATKMIIEAVTSKKCELLSLDILQQRLHGHLRKKRFLLVIDNLLGRWISVLGISEALADSWRERKQGSHHYSTRKSV